LALFCAFLDTSSLPMRFICSLTARHYPRFPSGLIPSFHWPLAATRRLCHRQFTGRRGAGHRRGDAKDRTRPDHGGQALSYYSPAGRFRRRNRPIFSKFIPRQPFLATAHWSSCLVGPGAISAGDGRFASSSDQRSNVCLFSHSSSLTRGVSHTPRGVREIITSALLTAWPRRPRGPILPIQRADKELKAPPALLRDRQAAA